jgi:HNH endonuclease
MRLPRELTPTDIDKALDWIDLHRNEIPPNRRVRKFALVRDGKEYPPKFVISKAYGLIHDHDWPNIFGGGKEANNFLITRKFKIIDKSKHPPEIVGIEAVEEDPSAVFREGGVLQLFRRHLRIERNRRVIEAAKNSRLKVSGDLRCEACGFSFQRTYGELGLGFIEAHHKIPLGRLRRERNTAISDIALLCANCHRMVHKSNPLLPIEALKVILKSQRRK